MAELTAADHHVINEAKRAFLATIEQTRAIFCWVFPNPYFAPSVGEATFGDVIAAWHSIVRCRQDARSVGFWKLEINRNWQWRVAVTLAHLKPAADRKVR